MRSEAVELAMTQCSLDLAKDLIEFREENKLLRHLLELFIAEFEQEFDSPFGSPNLFAKARQALNNPILQD